MQGKKLGVIGLGAIGVLGSKYRSHILEWKYYGYDPYISVDAAWNLSRSVKHVTRCAQRFIEECDYITIHVPLLDSTKKMINEEAIADDETDGAVVLNLCKRSSGR